MKYLLHSAPEVNRHVSQCLFWCFSRSPMSTFKHLWLNSCLAQDLISFLGPAWSCYCLWLLDCWKTSTGLSVLYLPGYTSLACAYTFEIEANLRLKPKLCVCLTYIHPFVQVLVMLMARICHEPWPWIPRLQCSKTFETSFIGMSLQMALSLWLVVAWKWVDQVSITWSSPCKEAKAIVRALENPLEWEATRLQPRSKLISPTPFCFTLKISQLKTLSRKSCTTLQVLPGIAMLKLENCEFERSTQVWWGWTSPVK